MDQSVLFPIQSNVEHVVQKREKWFVSLLFVTLESLGCGLWVGQIKQPEEVTLESEKE